MSYKTDFIEFMVRSGVLRFGDFTTKSGRKSPYFVNTGNYRTGAQMSKLGKYYAECLKNNVGEDFDVLFGPAYKGIPLATVTACALYTEYGIDKPYCFNRKEVKDHGEGGNMVGAKLSDGDRVVIIEDVITAGTAIRETLPVLKAAAISSTKWLMIGIKIFTSFRKKHCNFTMKNSENILICKKFLVATPLFFGDVFVKIDDVLCLKNF